MLLGNILGHGSTRKSSVGARDLCCLPDKVLEEIALVLGEDKQLCLLNHITKVGDELVAFLGQTLGGSGERLRGEGAVERDIDLLVLRREREISGGTCATPEHC